MAAQAASRNDNSNIRLNYDASVIATAEKPRADGPKINLEEFLPTARISRLEIAQLNSLNRTNLMEQVGRRSELPQDVIDAMTQAPRFNPDYSRVIAASSAAFEPPAISNKDLRFRSNVNARAGGGTAVGAVQDQQQQDCCNCCTLQ
jgi:hypothetical protein